MGLRLGLASLLVVCSPLACSSGGENAAAGSGGGAGAGSGGGSGGNVAGGSAGTASAGSAGTSNAGSGGTSSGGSAGSGGGGGFVAPTLLSETGLYSDIESETLAEGVVAYTPAYELWSDGAEKQRWVYLPPDSTIDTSDMDYWSYPVGTKLWKEFERDGVRVETRLIHKYEEDKWFMMAFHWNDEQTEATAVPDGVVDASGTDHDVPDRFKCGECHNNMKDKVLGFSAIQLSHGDAGVTLDSLIATGKLSDAPTSAPVVQGTDTEKSVLGYLHANCGHCHNDGGTAEPYTTVKMRLWLDTSTLSDPTSSPTYLTTIDQETESSKGTAGTRVVPQNTSESRLYGRFTSADATLRMPPVGTEVMDPDGETIIENWINALPVE